MKKYGFYCAIIVVMLLLAGLFKVIPGKFRLLRFYPGNSPVTDNQFDNLKPEVSYAPLTGSIVTLKSGDDLQRAIDRAEPGDTIQLPAGLQFVGNFSLPAKHGAKFIYIRTATADANLPPPGTRITPKHAGLMPKIITPNSQPAIKTEPAAGNYRFIGIEFGITPATTNNYGIIALGGADDDQDSLAEVPGNIIIDRCYIHGNDTGNCSRGIALNSAATAIIDSYIANIHAIGRDSQAICGWNGPGPFIITNNYLEGAGENVMFGGADPKIAGLVPANIEFRRNYCFKPLSWKEGDPTYAGNHWSVKNLFELKNAKQVIIDGNIFENNWADGQAGFAIVFTPRNQDGAAPWSVIKDITFTNNIVRHSRSGINILGFDDSAQSQQAKQIKIINNLFEDIGSASWGNGNGCFLQVLNGTDNVEVEHNTIINRAKIIMAEGKANTNFSYCNNIAFHNEYGICGTGTAPGNQTIANYFPGSRVQHNLIIGGSRQSYPDSNSFPKDLNEISFTNISSCDYRINPKSHFKNIGGSDAGANIDKLNTATRGVKE